ncbi:MAG: CHAT domain-containing tetratricopeptide repeat protein [Rubrivivax sp.]
MTRLALIARRFCCACVGVAAGAAAAATVSGRGADCARLVAEPQQTAWAWHPADPRRGVLVVDDGRVRALAREAASAPPRLARPWPVADCADAQLPAPTLRPPLPDAAAAVLVDAVHDDPGPEAAANRAGGLEARADHWRRAEAQLRQAWPAAADDALGRALLDQVQALAARAAADAGEGADAVAEVLERRWRALRASQGPATHATLEALADAAAALEMRDRQREARDRLAAEWPAVEAALPAASAQRLQLQALRLRVRLATERAAAVMPDAQALLDTLRAAPPADAVLLQDAELTVARVQLAAGRTTEAMALLESLARRLGPAPTRRGARVQDRLGLAYTRSGRLSEGLLASQRSFAMSTALVGPGHPDALRAYNNHADTLRQLGDVEAALPFAQRAFDGFRRQYGDGSSIALISARNVSLQLGELQRVDEALAVVQPQVQAALGRLDPDDGQLLDTRIHLIELLDLAGRHAEAVAEGEAVLPRAERRFGRDGELTVVAALVLAQAHAGTGALDRARALLQSAADSIERIPDQRRALSLLNLASQVAERTQDPVRHEALLRRFVDIAEQTDRSGLSEELAAWVHEFRAGPHLRWTVMRAERGEVDAAFDLSERFKGRVLLATLGRLAGDQSRVLPEALRAELAAARQRIREAEAQQAAATEPAAQVAAGERRESAARDYLALRERARREHPRFAAVAEAPTLGSADVAQVLERGQCLLSFVLAEAHAGVFVLARGQPIRWHTLPPTKAIDDTVQRLRAAWSSASADPAAAAAAARLLEPALRSCPRATRRLIVSPDGSLALLPLEPLVVQGRPLVQRYTVGYVQSLSVLGLLKRRGTPRGDRALLGVGAPTFAAAAPEPEAGVSAMALRSAAQSRAVATLDSDPQAARRAFDAMGQQWAPLPGAARELREVAHLFGRSALLTGDDATEAGVAALNDRGELARYRHLLFATHGFLSYTHPQLSAIVLRQPGSDQHDGYLTAAELPLLHLDSELVVLSACETGVGPLRAGSGVMGLPLALMAAGNRHAVVSLWSVPDQGTGELVIRLFRHVRQGRTPSQALTLAKRELMAQPRFASPLHWAGFVVYGVR